jgi:hypothetical protein
MALARQFRRELQEWACGHRRTLEGVGLGPGVGETHNHIAGHGSRQLQAHMADGSIVRDVVADRSCSRYRVAHGEDQHDADLRDMGLSAMHDMDGFARSFRYVRTNGGDSRQSTKKETLACKDQAK